MPMKHWPIYCLIFCSIPFNLWYLSQTSRYCYENGLILKAKLSFYSTLHIWLRSWASSHGTVSSPITTTLLSSDHYRVYTFRQLGRSVVRAICSGKPPFSIQICFDCFHTMAKCVFWILIRNAQFWITQCTHERSNRDIWITQCTHERRIWDFAFQREKNVWVPCQSNMHGARISCASVHYAARGI